MNIYSLLQKLTKKKELLFILLIVFFLFIPMFLLTYNAYPRLDSDYDSNLPVYRYIVDFVRQHHTFPLDVPYIDTGMPLWGDVSSAFLNPFFITPLLLFGVNNGIKIVYLLMLLFSTLTMWILLNSVLKKTDYPPKTSFDKITSLIKIWGSLLYAFSGAFIARVAAGHFEKTLTYPLIPLFCFYALKKRLHFSQAVIMGGILAFCFYSADIYGAWFLSIFLLCIRGYYFFTEPHEKINTFISSILVFFFFLLFSLVKLIPILYIVGFDAVRYAPINSFAGSVHSFLLPLMYIVPLQVNFYDRPFFERHIGFYYNWYEYYGFISIFPFYFLISIKNIIKETKVKIFILLLVVCALYLGLKYPYSPFYYVFKYIPFVQSIRVPQRIVLPSVAIVVVLLAYCAQSYIQTSKSKKKYLIAIGIFLLSILSTYIIFFFTFKRTFVPINYEDRQLVHELRQKDASKFYVVNFAAPDTFLLEERIYVYNYYYSWKRKEIPNFLAKDGQHIDYSPLQKIRPAYVITHRNVNIDRYGYFQFLRNNDLIIWKTNIVTIRPSL